MALEDLLTKLIASLDANTAAVKGGGSSTGTKAAATGTKAAASGKTIQFDEVKAAAAKVMDKQGKPFTKKMIKDVGGANELATVKPEKYGALMAAFEKALAENGGSADEEDEDEL
jgi:hypothetical protein